MHETDWQQHHWELNDSRCSIYTKFRNYSRNIDLLTTIITYNWNSTSQRNKAVRDTFVCGGFTLFSFWCHVSQSDRGKFLQGALRLNRIIISYHLWRFLRVRKVNHTRVREEDKKLLRHLKRFCFPSLFCDGWVTLIFYIHLSFYFTCKDLYNLYMIYGNNRSDMNINIYFTVYIINWIIYLILDWK